MRQMVTKFMGVFIVVRNVKAKVSGTWQAAKRVFAKKGADWVMVVPSSTWATKTAMPTGRRILGLATYNSKAYAMGGYTTTQTGVNEVYSPITNTWASLLAMPSPKHGLGAAAYGAYIYALGGYPGQTNQRYDPAANLWNNATLTQMGSVRDAVAVQARTDGKIYVTTGMLMLTRKNAHEYYDTVANVWGAYATIPLARAYPTSAVMDNNDMYVIGGDPSSFITTQVDKYNAAANTWSTVAPILRAADTYGAGVIGGNVYSAGVGTEVYDATLNVWMMVTADQPNHPSNPGAGILDGALLLVGGASAVQNVSRLDIY